MNTDDLEGMTREYREFERKMDEVMEEMDRIDAIIDRREKEAGEFSLPRGFDPQLIPEDDKKMMEKCEVLENEIANRGFVVELDQNAPLKAHYLYVQHIALITEGLQMPGEWNSHFNGCKGWCEDCFQRKWCRAMEEIERQGQGK